MKNFIIGIFVLGIGVVIGWLANDYQNRPCILQERMIVRKYERVTDMQNSDPISRGLAMGRMYAELAENGCAENTPGYREKAAREFDAIKASMEIKVDMQKVADTVNEAARQAADAVGKAFDQIKNTKVSITVE